MKQLKCFHLWKGCLCCCHLTISNVREINQCWLAFYGPVKKSYFFTYVDSFERNFLLQFLTSTSARHTYVVRKKTTDRFSFGRVKCCLANELRLHVWKLQKELTGFFASRPQSKKRNNIFRSKWNSCLSWQGLEIYWLDWKKSRCHNMAVWGKNKTLFS